MRKLPLFVVVGLCCSVASADMIISNIGDTSGNGTLFGSTASTQYKAAGFTMGAQAYFLDGVSLAIDNATAGATAHVQIWEGAGTPQTLIQDLTDFSFPAGSGIYTWTPTSQITLDANMTYWVYVDNTINPGPSFVWDSGNTLPSGPAATHAGYIFNGNPSSFLNSYEVSGTIVPEPAAVILLAIGGLAALRRR